MTNVLVVDDEEDFCALMTTHLERKGCSVSSALDGFRALEVLEENGPYDVLVTDLAMPGMSGQDLLRKAREEDPWLEVIVITASDDVDTAISAMREHGAYDYLIKPLETITDLSIAVERANRHRTLRKEKDQLSAQLVAEASRLQALIMHTGDAILSANGLGEITVANPTAAALFERDDLTGKNGTEILPEPFVGLIENWKTMGESKPAVVEVVWPEEAVQYVSLTPIADVGNGGEGWVMVIRDITHLKNIDELKMRMLTEAAGKIRIPLAQAVSSLAELGDFQAPEGSEHSATIYQLAKLLSRIQAWMDELLSLVRIEAGIGFQSMEVDLHRVLDKQMLTQFEEMNRDKGLKLKVNLEKPLPLLSVDPGLMSKMILGLLNRAATRSGSGGAVTLDARQNHGQVWIEVTDQGFTNRKNDDSVGEVEGDLETFKTDREGEGFGLEMVKSIVTRMGGQVWVRGQETLGSTIAISLPGLDQPKAEGLAEA